MIPPFQEAKGDVAVGVGASKKEELAEKGWLWPVGAAEVVGEVIEKRDMISALAD